MSAIFEWVNDSGTLGVPPMPPPAHPQPTSVASAEIATINQTYYELTVYLNGLISQLAKNYNVSKQQVFDVMKSRVKIGLPWCTNRTAAPGDPAPSCGLPPMAPGAPPCCLMWWPDDCSFAGIVELPYRPRPPCQSTIIKWTDTYALDIGAYQTGMNAYINWKTDLQSKLDAIKAALKKLQPAGPVPGGKPAPLPGEADADPKTCWPVPQMPPTLAGSPKWAVQVFDVSGGTWKVVEHNGFPTTEPVAIYVRVRTNVPSRVVYVYDYAAVKARGTAVVTARYASTNLALKDCSTVRPPGFPDLPAQTESKGDGVVPSGDTEGATGTKKDNTALYVVGVVAGATVLYFVFR